MARMVMLQFCVAFVIAAIAWLVFGNAAGISSLLGGLCYALPNALFALRLHLATQGGANPATFFVGEFLKIVTIVALLATVVWLYRDLNWSVFLISFIVVLKSYFILLFRNLYE